MAGEEFAGLLYEISRAVTTIFNLAPDKSLNYVYGLVFVTIVTWFTLAGYMLTVKPKMLDKWKIPTMSSLAILSLVGAISYIVSYLFINALIFLNSFETKNEIISPQPNITVIFMILYMLFLLRQISISKSFKDVSFIPGELIYFIPISFGLSLGLLFFNLGLYFMHDALQTGLVHQISNLPIYRKWIGIISAFILGIISFIATYMPKKFEKEVDKIYDYFKESLILVKDNFKLILAIIAAFVLLIIGINYLTLIF